MAKRVPASIRNKNPGAFWGKAKNGKLNPLSVKWGATGYEMLSDGLGQGNNIATFGTFEDGICATLDLWRTSAYYKNKKLKDALHTWSGGNNTESYIKLMISKVPGLTRDTVLNDNFWRSPACIQFLKTQAQHEAGQKYPAAEEDWINAQRRVMGIAAPQMVADAPNINSQPPDHEDEQPLNIQPETAKYSVEVEVVQRNLDSIGYHEIGLVDGLWGGKTVAAIAAFFNDRGVKEVPVIGQTLNDELAQAKSEEWTRPISIERAMTKPPELAEKNEAVRMNLLQRFWAKIAALGAAAGLTGTSLSNTFDSVQGRLGSAHTLLAKVPPEVWLLFVLAVAGGVWYANNRAAKASTRDYNVGRLN